MKEQFETVLAQKFVGKLEQEVIHAIIIAIANKLGISAYEETAEGEVVEEGQKAKLISIDYATHKLANAGFVFTHEFVGPEDQKKFVLRFYKFEEAVEHVLHINYNAILESGIVNTGNVITESNS